jgi:hypothetical protein
MPLLAMTGVDAAPLSRRGVVSQATRARTQ